MQFDQFYFLSPTADDYSHMETSLVDSLLPLVDATQGLAFTCFVFLLTAISAILILHLLGILTFHFIKTRQLYAVRTVYVVLGVAGMQLTPKRCYDSPEAVPRLDRTMETDDTDCTAPSSPCLVSASDSMLKPLDTVIPPYPKTLQMPSNPSMLHPSGQIRGHDEMTSSKSLSDVGFSETKV